MHLQELLVNFFVGKPWWVVRPIRTYMISWISIYYFIKSNLVWYTQIYVVCLTCCCSNSVTDIWTDSMTVKNHGILVTAQTRKIENITDMVNFCAVVFQSYKICPRKQWTLIVFSVPSSLLGARVLIGIDWYEFWEINNKTATYFVVLSHK